MSSKRDIIDLLFEKKEEENAFETQNKELTTSRKKIYRTSEALEEFIKNMVPDSIKSELRELISSRNEALYDSFYVENKLFYKTGIIDGLFLKKLNPYEN